MFLSLAFFSPIFLSQLFPPHTHAHTYSSSRTLVLSCPSYDAHLFSASIYYYQRIYRGHQGKEKHTKLLLDRAAGRFSAKYKAAEKLKHFLQRFTKRIKAKKDSSALVIQNATRSKIARKRVSGLREIERSKKENQRVKDEEMSEKIKAADLIGKMARDRSAIKDAKGQKDKLLTEKQRRERELMSEKEKREKEREDAINKLAIENGAALSIQAMERGR